MSEPLFTFNANRKRIDNFYVTFLSIPENITNVLGRQVQSITRPNISFDRFETKFRRNTYQNSGQVRFDPISVVFKDDEESVTSMFLYAQVFRQLNKHVDVFGQNDAGKERKFTFGMKVQFLNSLSEVVEEYIMNDCFIEEINHTDPLISEDTENEITVSIAYDNIDILVFDRYLSMTQQLQQANP